MIFGIKGMALAGVAGLALGGVIGVKGGVDLEKLNTVKQVNAVKVAAAKVLDTQIAETKTVTTERDQARAEVDKFNRATTAQAAATLAAAQDDLAKRDAAGRRMETLLQQTSRDARAAAERSDAAREVIKNVADQCARAGVPADVLSVLDTLLDPSKAGLRNGAMPAARGPDRP